MDSLKPLVKNLSIMKYLSLIFITLITSCAHFRVTDSESVSGAESEVLIYREANSAHSWKSAFKISISGVDYFELQEGESKTLKLPVDSYGASVSIQNFRHIKDNIDFSVVQGKTTCLRVEASKKGWLYFLTTFTRFLFSYADIELVDCNDLNAEIEKTKLFN